MATQTRNPTSDLNETGTWSGGSAGTRYTIVDDHPDSGGTDMLTAGTAASTLRFGFTAFSLPSAAVVSKITIYFYTQRTGAGAVTHGPRLRIAGTNYDQTIGTTSTSLVLKTHEWTTNPRTTAAWTKADVEGTGSDPLEAFGLWGTDLNPTCQYSSIQIEATYTEAATATSAVTGPAKHFTSSATAARAATSAVTGPAKNITSSASKAASATLAVTGPARNFSTEYTADTGGGPEGTASVSGGGTASTSGQKGGQAQGLIDGGGDATLIGQMGARGAIDASAGGSSSSAATKASSATSSVTGGGEFAVVGEAEVPGTTTVLVTGGGTFVVAASRASATTVLVTGGGEFTTEGGQPIQNLLTARPRQLVLVGGRYTY